MKNRPCLLVDADIIGENLTHAVYKRLRKFGKSFWIATFQPWVHPYNRVPNCMALSFDGFIHYKFSMKYDEKKSDVFYQVVKRAKNSFVMDVKNKDRLTYTELLKKIKTAKVG